MKHSLDVEIAKEYGIEAALLLNGICYWTNYHRANGTNFYDGRFWVYNSYRAWTELFPYFTENQIRRYLEKLVEEEILCKGNYNKMKFDHTTWYSLTDKGLEVCKNNISNWRNCQIVVAEKPKGSGENNRPIPIINTIINTNNTTTTVDGGSDELATLVNFWNANYRPITERDYELLKSTLKDFGFKNTMTALEIGNDNNRKTIAYVEGVAKNLANGVDLRKKFKTTTVNIDEAQRKRFEKIARAEIDERDYTEIETKVIYKAGYQDFRYRKVGTDAQWTEKLCNIYAEMIKDGTR